MAGSKPTLFDVHVRSSARGFTLAELLVVVAILGIIAALAVPAFNDSIARARVKNATENIHGLVMLAKTEGRIRDTNLSVAVNTERWCMGVAAFQECDCTLTEGDGACVLPVAGEPVLHTVLGDEFPGVTISENFSGVGTTFYRLRGNASPWGTLSVTARGQTLEIKISSTGRARVCTPDGSYISGYPSC